MMADDPLMRLREVMLVSAITSALLLCLLLLLTRWRSQWVRLLAWEESFWSRLGANRKWLAWMRDFEGKRFLVVSVGVLLLLHLVIFGTAATAYFYFNPKLSKGRAPHAVQRSLGPSRPEGPASPRR